MKFRDRHQMDISPRLSTGLGAPFFFASLLLCFFASSIIGCAKLQYVDELLTLKGLADNQTETQKYIEHQDENFEKLREAVNDQQIQDFKTKEQILKKFGEPVYRREVEEKGQNFELLVYRYSMKYFDSEKVYLYFSPEGQLFRWQLIQPGG